MKFIILSLVFFSIMGCNSVSDQRNYIISKTTQMNEEISHHEEEESP